MMTTTSGGEATVNVVKLSNGRSDVWFRTDKVTGETTVTRNCVKRHIGRRAASNQIAKLVEKGYKVISAA